MGRIDLDFKPAVPVFDANMALGRRHNRRQSVDTAADTLAEMNRGGSSVLWSTRRTRPSTIRARAMGSCLN